MEFTLTTLLGIILFIISLVLFWYALKLRQKTSRANMQNTALLASRKINRIILEELDYDNVVQKIADYIPSEMHFATGVLALIDKDKGVIRRVAASRTKEAEEAIKALQVPFNQIEIPISDPNNLMARAVREHKSFTTENAHYVFTPVLSEEESQKIQHIMQTKTTLIYPIFLRSEPIGVFIASTGKLKAELTNEELEIIQTFVDGAAIALQHSVLFTNLKKSTDSLQEANERLKQIDKLKDEFVSLASHELRTPMTVIKNYLWMLLYDKKSQLTDTQKQYTERAYASVDRLIALVNDMLNVSRIESGRLTINLQPIDIKNLVEETVTEIEPQANTQEIHLYSQTPDTKLRDVVADSSRIKEVLINLIGNALKFTPKGGEIKVSLIPDEEKVTIQVTDTGKGIKAEDLPKLFKKFSIIGSDYLRKLNSQGTGLGLYLSKSIIELHGGKIWVESKGEDRGATFSFTLPYEQKLMQKTQQATD